MTTWAGVAVLAFGAGAAALRAVPNEAKPVLATPPPYEIVSRARDSELEVSPSLAAARDGTLAVAWIAESGGRDGGGRWIGVRVSAPNAGKLGPTMRVATRGETVADASLAPLAGGDFLLAWEAGKNVYATRVSRAAVAEPVLVAERAAHPRAASTPNGTALVSFDFEETGKRKLALAVSHDGKTFPFRIVAPSGDGTFAAPCGDDHVALVAEVDPARGVLVHREPLDEPQPEIATSTVSTLGEHVARERPSCFVSDQEAFVVYGVTDRPQNDAESRVAESLEFVRSRDGGRNFLTRAAHRTPSHLVLPTILHQDGAFTLLAVMGSGVGDAHASASVLVLGADGRTQSGLTRTVVSPMTMTASEQAPGWMGDSLGLAEAAGAIWAAVPDNGAGESHVALVRLL